MLLAVRRFMLHKFYRQSLKFYLILFTLFIIFSIIVHRCIQLATTPLNRQQMWADISRVVAINRPKLIVIGKLMVDENGKLQYNNDSIWSSVETSKNIDNEQMCRIPQLQVDAPEVIKFFHKLQPLVCDSKETNWVFVRNNRLYIDDAAVVSHGKITCQLVQFWRKSDSETIESRTVNSAIENGSLVGSSDYFRAECKATDGSSWSNLFMTVVPKKETIDRVRKVKKPIDWSGLNVYIISFDSLSRLTFQRKMPVTFDYLTKQLNAVILEGYNIVGDGTPQAFLPILTSKTELEMPLTRKRYVARANYVDDVYPFIWNNFSQNGYVTLFAEDDPTYGMFSYRLKGFRRQPTDHYLRTFFQQFETESSSNLLCIGSEPQHQAWFRYGQEFFMHYPSDIAKFAFMHHGALSHDDANRIELADIDFRVHLQSMQSSGQLDNTLLIVMADHGSRFAEMRATHQGQIEERLPLFAIVLPDRFRRGKAFENLQMNAKRLTTPFDIYSTLIDILHWPSSDDLITSTPGRSMSLWRPIHASRNCPSAGIEPHWCTCLNREPIPIDQRLIIGRILADAVVDAINAETESERSLCARLQLDVLIDAYRLTTNYNLMNYRNAIDDDGFVPNLNGRTAFAFVDFQLQLRTRPGAAIYESTVRYEIDVNRVIVDMRSISHLNAYGDHPHCVVSRNSFIATYCVCYDRM